MGANNDTMRLFLIKLQAYFVTCQYLAHTDKFSRQHNNIRVASWSGTTLAAPPVTLLQALAWQTWGVKPAVATVTRHHASSSWSAAVAVLHKGERLHLLSPNHFSQVLPDWRRLQLECSWITWVSSIFSEYRNANKSKQQQSSAALTQIKSSRPIPKATTNWVMYINCCY